MLAAAIYIVFSFFSNFSVCSSTKEELRVKVRLYYESKLPGDVIIIEAPDYECERMIERDYQIRLSEASDKSKISRRTVQEILDEELNKPTFNNNQTETRRHISLDALDPEDKYITEEAELSERLQLPEKDRLSRAMLQLRPDQRRLVHQVFFEGYSQHEIAEIEGVDETAVSKRMSRIYARLRKALLKEKEFSF